MSQSDISLADQTGYDYVQSVNAALQAVATDFSGNSEPSETFPYMRWRDTSVSPSVLKIRNATNTAWITETVPIPNTGITAGTYKSLTVGADGRATGGTNPTTLEGFGITDATPAPDSLSEENPSATETFTLRKGALWVRSTVSSLASYVLNTFTFSLFSGASSRKLTDYLKNNRVSILDFGAVGDGTTNNLSAINSAITTIAGKNCSLSIPKGTYRLSGSVSFPKNISLVFERGAMFSVDSSYTLTIAGKVVSEGGQHFTGSGSIYGIRRVNVEWFGAKADGTTDDAPSIQKAINCASQTTASYEDHIEVLLMGGLHVIKSAIVITPTANNNYTVRGAGSVFGTRFVVPSDFSGTIALAINGSAGTIDRIANFKVCDFSIARDTGSSCIAGVHITAAEGEGLQGLNQSLCENISVVGFPFAWLLRNVRMVKLDRCASWGDSVSDSVGLQISSTLAGGFCGDIDIVNCQFVAPTSSGKSVYLVSNASGSQIKGVRFTNTVFYKGVPYVEIYAASGGIIGDIWFNPGCQWDGFGATQLKIEATGASSLIDNVQAQGCYFRGVNSGYNAVTASALSSAQVKSLIFTNNFIANVNDRAITCENISGSVFKNNVFYDVDCGSGYVMLFNATSRTNISGNILHRSGPSQAAYMVAVGSGSDYLVINDNVGGGIVASGVVLNLSGGSHLTITGNI